MVFQSDADNLVFGDDNGEADIFIRDRAVGTTTLVSQSNSGLGTDSAHDVWQAFARSKAAQSGLLTDLEDTVLMIDGVRADIVSDITTNIIRSDCSAPGRWALCQRKQSA